MPYFTIKTKSDVGIGDQLVTQFKNIYVLGKALGYDYVHSPLYFPRSYTPWLVSTLIQLIFVIKRILFLLPFSTRSFVKFLLRFENKISQVKLPFQNNSLSKFLGFPDNDETKSMIFKDIILDKAFFLDTPNITSLKQKISTTSPLPNIRLIWTNDSYHIIPQLYALIGNTNNAKPYALRPQISPFKLKSFDKNTLLKIAIHIRLGDSTAIRLGNSTFFVNDVNVLNEQEMTDILKIDPNRKNTNIADYAPCLEALHAYLNDCRQPYQIIILSDGYKRTLNTLMNNYLLGRIVLSKLEKTKFNQLFKNPDNIIQKSINIPSEFIIGEDKRSLFSSIFVLSEANIVLFGTGGFAYGLHELYRQNDTTFLMHIKDFETKTVALNDFIKTPHA